MHELVPGLSGIAAFGVGRNPPPDVILQRKLLEDAVQQAQLKYEPHPSSGPPALEALATMRARGFEAAIYFNNPNPLGRDTARLHADTAIRHRVATMGYFANMADDGLLASYGELDSDLFLRLAQQVDRVLRGGNPAEIPFMAPQRFHLRVNRATAAALKLAISPEVRIMADEIVG